MLTTINFSVAASTLFSRADHDPSQRQKYEDRTKKIRLDEQSMRAVEDAVERILSTYPDVPNDDQYMSILKKIHGSLLRPVSSELSRKGFKTVSAYSLYPKSNARYKVQVLKEFFKESAPGVADGPRNYKGNIEYCNRANNTQLSSTEKHHLYAKLAKLIEQEQGKYDCTRYRSMRLGDRLTDADYRKILAKFCEQLTSNQRQALNKSGIKTVSKYSWYSNSRAKFKVHALFESWSLSEGKMGDKWRSMVHAGDKVFIIQGEYNEKYQGNWLIAFLAYTFFLDYSPTFSLFMNGKIVAESSFIDVNLPRLFKALSLVSDASAPNQAATFTLTNNEKVQITKEVSMDVSHLCFKTFNDTETFSIKFVNLTPQQVIDQFSSIPNIRLREQYLNRLSSKLSQARHPES